MMIKFVPFLLAFTTSVCWGSVKLEAKIQVNKNEPKTSTFLLKGPASWQSKIQEKFAFSFNTVVTKDDAVLVTAKLARSNAKAKPLAEIEVKCKWDIASEIDKELDGGEHIHLWVTPSKAD